MLALALAALAMSPGQAAAQAVGNVGAVTPLSLGTPPGEKTRHMVIGARVIANELIQTSGEGMLNVVFLDRTTLSIGRNSTLVIDKYVYDPATGKGVMTATMAQGVMRFIGGQISHTTGVKVLTPVATIGVRGGMMTVSVGPDGVNVMSHYGHIDVANDVGHQLILRSGFTVHVGSRHDSIATPGQTSLQALDAEYAALSAGKGVGGGLGDAGTRFSVAGAPLPNDPDSMPGPDTIGMVNLGQTFVGNRSQQQQFNGARIPPPRWNSSGLQ
ncbi:FecR family protein [Methylovirgula ligni]|uniref:FecR family protein n=2 Tax=Methylovirgula ligni TaxID=569860 RepID=A0A3D9YUY4_9HYPH|nr:FecR domain-containing protein [Methylovirgula ligni]REF85968.1 FecR family protein [Methylovirgula ligni]